MPEVRGERHKKKGGVLLSRVVVKGGTAENGMGKKGSGNPNHGDGGVW